MAIEERASRRGVRPFREAGPPPTVVLGYRVKLREEERHYLKRRSGVGKRALWPVAVHLAEPPRGAAVRFGQAHPAACSWDLQFTKGPHPHATLCGVGLTGNTHSACTCPIRS